MSVVEPSIHPSAHVHPSARVDPSSRVDAGVRIEADVIVGPSCVIGAGTRLRARSIIVEHTTMGQNNDVHPYAVIGGDPQDKSFDESRRGEVIIGDRNIFREGVTINRGNWNGPPTRVGSGCYLMTIAHLGHNSSIGDNVVMANGASLAGHARVASNCTMSAYSAVHQFTDVGEGVMFRGGAMASMHVPPFLIVAELNFIAGLNAVGLKRNPSMTPTDRDEIKRVYRAIYRQRSGAPIDEAIAMLREQPWGAGASKFLDFITFAMGQEKPRSRGICSGRKMAIRSRSAPTALTDTASIEN